MTPEFLEPAFYGSVITAAGFAFLYCVERCKIAELETENISLSQQNIINEADRSNYQDLYDRAFKAKNEAQTALKEAKTELEDTQELHKAALQSQAEEIEAMQEDIAAYNERCEKLDAKIAEYEQSHKETMETCQKVIDERKNIEKIAEGLEEELMEVRAKYVLEIKKVQSRDIEIEKLRNPIVEIPAPKKITAKVTKVAKAKRDDYPEIPEKKTKKAKKKKS